jgi:hypothetical protein
MNDTAALQKCFSEAKINGLTLRNRIIKAGTFEGKTPTGLPTPELTELHRRIGEGGTAMTTLAYCAAENNGRLHADMMYMNEYVYYTVEIKKYNLPKLRKSIAFNCGGGNVNAVGSVKGGLAPYMYLFVWLKFLLLNFVG